MATVNRMIIVFVSMRLNDSMAKHNTRHAIAKNINSVSRSTIYRLVARMIALGFLYLLEAENGDVIVAIAPEGFLFWNDANMLEL